VENFQFFYRAMHFNAIACRPSVTLVDQDHIGWKSWKLIARTISTTPLLFVHQRRPITPRGTWENFGKNRGGVGNSAVLEHKSGNISETRKHMEGLQELTNALSNSTIPDPYGLLFPNFGGSQPRPRTLIAIISRTGKATNFEFCTHILSIDRNKSPLKISGKVAMGVIRDSRKFSGRPCIGRIARSSLR